MKKFTQLFEYLSQHPFIFDSGSKWVMEFTYSADGRSISYKNGILNKDGQPKGYHIGIIPEDAIVGADVDSFESWSVFAYLRLSGDFPYEYQDAFVPGMGSVLASKNSIGLMLTNRSEAEYVVKLVEWALS